MTSGLKQLVRIVLLLSEEHQIILSVLSPTGAILVKEASIVAIGVRVNDTYRRLYSFLLTSFLIHDSLFDFLGLDVVAKFTVHALAETLNHTATIALKASIDCRICSGQCNISLMDNVVTCQDTADGSQTKKHRRSIKLCELHTSLNIDNSKILLTIFFGVLHITDIACLHAFVDRVDRLLGFFDDGVHFCCGLACHDCTRYYASDASNEQDLRTVLLNLETYSMEGFSCRINNIAHVHSQISSLKLNRQSLRHFQ